MSKLAVAWLLHRELQMMSIRGTTSVAHLLDDLGTADDVLRTETMNRLDSLINQLNVGGERYDTRAASEVDAETF